MLKTTKHLLALALSAAMLLGSPGMLTAFADNGDDLTMAKSLSVQTIGENGNEISPFVNDYPSAAFLTVSINGRFYLPGSQTHDRTIVNYSIALPVNFGENPTVPVKAYFEKGVYTSSTSDPHYLKEGYQLTLQYGDDTPREVNAWVFDRDMTGVEVEKTFNPQYNPGGHGEYTLTMYLSSLEGTPIPDPGAPEEPESPTAPDKPENDDIINNLENVVRVDCVNSQIEPQHEDKDYDLISDTFSVGDVENEGTSEEPQWQVVISLNDSAPYVTAYNQDIGVEHTRNDENDSRTITLEYNADSESEWKWEIASQTPVIYEVICKTPDPEEPTAPDKPEDDDIINNLENVVRIDCVNNQIEPQHEDKDYSLISDTFSVGDVENEGTNEEPQWQVIISLNDSAPYVTAYNESIGVEHTKNDENDSRTITLEYNADSEREWKWEITSETPVVYEVICKNTTPDPGPDTPDPTPNPDPAPDPTPNPEPQPEPDPEPDRPSRPNRDDDDDWEPLPDAPVKEKAETVEVETEVPEQTETQTPVQQPEKHNPETGDASFAPVSLALAAASLSAAALLARKRK